MKRATVISILCTVMLTACGNVSESVESVETSAVSQTTTTVTGSAVTSGKEEKDTSEAATTTFKTSSQTVSETSKPTDITVTTTKKSGSSNANGNSNQGQNNNGQENNHQPVQNDPQPDNSPSNDPQSNNGAEQNNDPTPPTTTAKPAVTNPPDTTTKPQTTVPQTEPPEVVIEDTTNLQSVLNYVNSLGRTTDEYYNIGAGLSHDGSDYGKAEAVYNWIQNNVSGNCQVFSVATMYACKGIGLECRYAFFSPDDWYGHMANLVNVDGAWYVFDTQGGRFLKSDKYGDITRIFDESDITIDISVSESAY